MEGYITPTEKDIEYFKSSRGHYYAYDTNKNKCLHIVLERDISYPPNMRPAPGNGKFIINDLARDPRLDTDPFPCEYYDINSSDFFVIFNEALDYLKSYIPMNFIAIGQN